MASISINNNLNKVLIFSANSSWYLFNFRLNTLKAFLNNGYKVYCLSPMDDYSHLLEDIGCSWIKLDIDNKGFNPFVDLKLFFNLFKIFYRIKPSTVFNFTIKNNIYGTFASFLLRIRSINNISGFGTAFIHSGLKYFIARRLYIFALKLSTKVFCQNKDDYKFILENRFVDESRIDLLPGSGIDLNKFQKKANKISPSINDFIFIYAGRLLYDKGIKELVKAFDQIDQSRFPSKLWIIGFRDSKNISAIKKSDIETWDKKRNIFILEPSNSIETVLSKVSCFVLPSYREGMPRSILEACAMELPIICTDVPGCRDIVTNNLNGYLCKPQDDQSLLEAMKNMLKLPIEKRLKMGVEGRKIVEQSFSEEIVIKKALDVIDDI